MITSAAPVRVLGTWWYKRIPYPYAGRFPMVLSVLREVLKPTDFLMLNFKDFIHEARGHKLDPELARVRTQLIKSRNNAHLTMMIIHSDVIWINGSTN